MKKKILLLGILLIDAFYIFSHSQQTHDNQLKQVLFGEHLYDCNYENMERLCSACYVAIDYCNGYRDKAYNLLRFKINLPEYNTNMKINRLLDLISTSGGGRHQRATHRGWSEVLVPKKEDREKWVIRRDKILVQTVSEIMQGNWDQNKINLFSQLCYYVHIIGDHEGDKFSTTTDRMQLVPRPDNKNSPSVVSELIRITEQFFTKKTDSYYSLHSSLLSFLTKNIEYNEKSIQNAASNLLDILTTYIPKLLLEDQVFVNKFYYESIDSEQAA